MKQKNRFSACGAYCIATLPDFEIINNHIRTAYAAVVSDPSTRRTHYFHGRFENTYIALDRIPTVRPIVDHVLEDACQILDVDELNYGFWFNEMAPGHKTTRHNHDELDELLSCVYYIDVPLDSGDLLLYPTGDSVHITPQAGKVIYFDPAIDHEVAINSSRDNRLSIAFNFGLSVV